MTNNLLISTTMLCYHVALISYIFIIINKNKFILNINFDRLKTKHKVK